MCLNIVILLLSSLLETDEKRRTSQVALVVKKLLANAGDMRHEFDPWVGKMPWRRAWQPTPGLLPGKFHGQRSLADYSQWGHKELDVTEATGHSHGSM